MPERYTLKLKTQLAETKRTLPTESKHKDKQVTLQKNITVLNYMK